MKKCLVRKAIISFDNIIQESGFIVGKYRLGDFIKFNGETSQIIGIRCDVIEDLDNPEEAGLITVFVQDNIYGLRMHQMQNCFVLKGCLNMQGVIAKQIKRVYVKRTA